MSGNVSEWVSDVHPYAVVRPHEEGEEDERVDYVHRGGSWASGHEGCRSAWRAFVRYPTEASSQVGLRLVKEP